MQNTISLNSFIPYYIQLLEILKGKISSGEWKPGDKLPSEPELCEIYGVSRTVVRQALQEMEYDGLIARKKGVGTFITEPKIDGQPDPETDRFSPGYGQPRPSVLITQVLRNEVIGRQPEGQRIPQNRAGDPGLLHRTPALRQQRADCPGDYLPAAGVVRRSGAL